LASLFSDKYSNSIGRLKFKLLDISCFREVLQFGRKKIQISGVKNIVDALAQTYQIGSIAPPDVVPESSVPVPSEGELGTPTAEYLVCG
jgi:hypothetical protein